MADVLMEYKGKQKRVPVDKVDVVKRAGGRVIDEAKAAVPAAPAESPGLLRRVLGSAATMTPDPNNPIDAHALGAAKAATFGNADVGAGIGGALGSAKTAIEDDASVGGILDALVGGYREARGEHRGLEDKAWEQSPWAYGSGMVPGTAATGALGTPGGGMTKGLGGAPVSTSLESQALRGGGVGAVSGVGFGDSDSIMGDLVNAYVGGTLGALTPVVAPIAAEGLGSIAGKVTGAGRQALASAKGSPVVQGTIKTVQDAAGDIPVVRHLKNLKKNIDAAKPPPPAPEVLDPAAADQARRAREFADEIDAIDADISPVSAVDEAVSTSPMSPDEVLSPADDVSRAIDDIDAEMTPVTPPPEAPAIPADDPLAALRAESAQDWGTVPRGDVDFMGNPVQTQTPANLPPPPPELVSFFLEKGATREQALAQAYAVMAKQFAGPQGAVGRQRSAVPFDESSPPPAPIATPKGRNRAAAPFRK